MTYIFLLFYFFFCTYVSDFFLFVRSYFSSYASYRCCLKAKKSYNFKLCFSCSFPSSTSFFSAVIVFFIEWGGVYWEKLFFLLSDPIRIFYRFLWLNFLEIKCSRFFSLFRKTSGLGGHLSIPFFFPAQLTPVPWKRRF